MTLLYDCTTQDPLLAPTWIGCEGEWWPPLEDDHVALRELRFSTIGPFAVSVITCDQLDVFARFV